jgi:spore maturation protein SpmB
MAKILAARGEAVLMKEPSLPQTGGEEPEEAPAPATKDLSPPGPVGRWVVWLLVTAFVGGMAYQVVQNPPSSLLGAASLNALSSWLIPILISGLLIYGYLRGVQVYEVLTEGAKEGFTTAVRIIPFLVAIFVAVGMFRASGAMDLLITLFTPLTSLINMPAESLAMAFMRPLSGSGAFGIMSEIVSQDPDSFLSFLVSTMQGSTETTFYVLAIYFGSIGIKRSRHALPAALCADAAGVLAAVAVCNFWF